MKMRTLGKSGYLVSEVGIGCWQLGGDFGPVEDERATEILAAADDAGITFWDTADVYGGGLSEQRIGDYVAGHRGERVVVTKVGRNAELYPDGYTKAKVRESLVGSLERLGGDALDLAQLHCVPTDVLKSGDLLSWMEEFQDEGLIRHFGTSVETMEEALFSLTHPKLTSVQTIFNIFRQDHITELFPAAVEADVGIIVRLPLASGVLSGKMTASHKFAETDHRNYNQDGAAFSVGETFSGVPFETAVELAAELASLVPEGLTMAQMALRWVLDHPAVSSVIAGASRPSQVIENAAVSDMPSLSAELHETLSAMYFDRVKATIRGVM
ncbi:MAG: aldo/keto reductase [Acidimicrobiales bacterium]|nr:aldo/keto reductase [Acidimicrobiales bacterium]